MSVCGTVYVLLADRPERDQLAVCIESDCRVHRAQVAWVEQDSSRLAAYREQVGRYWRGVVAPEGLRQAQLL